MTQSPWNEGYGLTDETRMKILKDAEIHGVKAAAEMNRVSNTIVYQWRKRLAHTQEPDNRGRNNPRG